MDVLLGDRPGLTFIVSAPAGTGKTTLMKRLTEEFPSIVASISYTTRKPREGEIHGIDYYFISDSEFQEKIKKSEFLEYVNLYGNYYGTSHRWIQAQLEKGKHVVLVIDTQGALQLKDKIEATYIFIQPPSFESLRSRLVHRQTESEDMIDKRLEWARMELDVAKHYDYLVINDDLEITYQVFRSIFIAECHRIQHKSNQ